MPTLRWLVNAGRGALPWLCLMLVSTTLAHAMQLGVGSASVTAAEVGSRTAPNIRPVDAATPARIVVVVIRFVDASGNQKQLECTTTAGRIPTDSLFLNLEDVRPVMTDLCESWSR